MKKEKGIFITIEGIEGCGKSTQAKMLGKYLGKKGLDVILTREPGGTEIGNQIRKILLDRKNKKILAVTELLLYAASRAQHVNEVIAPELAEGKIVVCDRFSDATTAYQGYGRGLDKKMISVLDKFSTGGLVPDLTIILDLPEKVGLERAKRRNREMGISRGEGRIEEEGLVFHRKVRRGYLKIAKDDQKRVKVINALRSMEEINAEICKEADKLIKRNFQ